MKLINEYDTRNTEFLNSMMFELYDEITKRSIYNFYNQFDDVKCYLPDRIDVDGKFDFVLEFSDKDSAVNDRLVKIAFANGNVDFVEI